MRETPLVSIIMPSYNSAAFIGEAIRSVQGQTHHNWELIIVDDASCDATVSIISDFLNNDPKINLLVNPVNRGAGYSRNRGIKAAAGDFIAFLDTDDIWLPGKLETQLKFMEENNLEMTFSSYFLMDENGRKLSKMIKALPVLTFEKLLRSNYVGNLTGIYDVRKTGIVLAPEIRKRQDWALWLSILKKHGKTFGISEPLAVYRVRENSISNNKVALLKYNYSIYKDFLGLGLLKSSTSMLRFLYEHFFVKSRQTKNLDEGSELL
ncbi:glycosyltransferase family 2 protein [soil metagenome]